tara:strand:- start:302 stop:634 length:333 start_codon:yes stop_codon:yes gene_type:complete
MGITMTEFAIEKISEMMKKESQKNNASYLRIGLKSGGCSGYSYIFEFSENCNENDKVLEFNQLKICIDKKSYLFLNGMEVDYEETPFRSGIKLNNPQATRTCGCGESVAF